MRVMSDCQYRYHACSRSSKIFPVAGEMRAARADLLNIEIDQISIKAKTPEGLNLDTWPNVTAVALVERLVNPKI